MEEKNKSLKNIIIAITSFCTSIVSVFTMYYIFATISVVTAIISLKNDDSKPMAITSLIIVGITLVVKIVNDVVLSGCLPNWLVSGLF